MRCIGSCETNQRPTDLVGLSMSTCGNLSQTLLVKHLRMLQAIMLVLRGLAMRDHALVLFIMEAMQFHMISQPVKSLM